MPQFARPAVDGDLDGWTDQDAGAVDVFEAIDETVADDADYVQSPVSPSDDEMRVQLSAVVDPATATGHILRWRAGKDPTSGGEQIDLTVGLYQGNAPGTLIVEKVVTDLAGSLTDDSITLSGPEANAISDYADLWLRIKANKP
jgi:hypothetical protein